MNTKLRIAIAEDDTGCSDLLLKYLHTFEQEYSQPLEITVFYDGAELLENFHSQFDLLLLDIEMPLMDGMTTAQHIRKQDSEVVILFITNMAQYAIRGYEVDALDYILKPVRYFFFAERLNRAISRIKRSSKHYLVLTLKGGSKKLAIEDIYYIESQRHNLIFHTKEGDFTILGTMTDIEAKLSDFSFFRCNKGYLVSLQYVDAIDDGCAVINGQNLLISRGRKKEFMEKLADFMGGITL